MLNASENATLADIAKAVGGQVDDRDIGPLFDLPCLFGEIRIGSRTVYVADDFLKGGVQAVARAREALENLPQDAPRRVVIAAGDNCHYPDTETIRTDDQGAWRLYAAPPI